MTCIIGVSCCGDFKRRNVEEAWKLIEDLAKFNYKAPSEASGSSSSLKGNGLIGLDRMTTIEAKLDAVMNKLGNNERRMHTAHEVGVVEERSRRRAKELVGEEPYQVEETKYMNEQRSYHFKPNPNLPTHYTPALRNHENFSYGGGEQQGPRLGQNYQPAYAQPRFQEQQQQRDNRGDYQGQKRTQSFEDHMLHFMSENKRILNLHEKRFSDLENFQANTIVFQTNTNATMRNLETQVGQLALSLQSQSRNAFPSSTEINPKDLTPTTLRGNDELQGSKKV